MKKQSIKQRREQEKAQRMNAYKKLDADRNAQMAAEKAAKEEAEKQKRLKEMQKNLHPVQERTLSAEKKSTAKAAGLKSTFVLGDNELLMTSFGRGNEAIVEKHVTNEQIDDIANPANLNVRKESIYYHIDGRIRDASTDNPLYHREDPRLRDDLIHARPYLERRYYGENFNDNIHIQCIYSTLDVEKILAIHINNIIYTLNNFLRMDGNDLADLIGNLKTYVSYEDFMEKEDRSGYKEIFLKLCRTRQLGYINLQVQVEENEKEKGDKKKTKREKDPNAIQLTQKEFYSILIALGTMRQMLAHGDPKQTIYQVEGFGKNSDITRILDRLYTERITELNKGFLKKAEKNLALLFEAFGVKSPEEKTKYVRDYYDFTVRKQYKNMGFSIKLLREQMTAHVEDAFILRSKDYDSVRGKLYPFVDFAIYRYYRERAAETEKLVGELRASMNEMEKAAIYLEEALRIWPNLKSLILDHILPEMSGTKIKDTKADPDVNPAMLEGVIISPVNVTSFSKFIYMVTLFINGKEINDLLTTLVHQFENIASFMDVMKERGLRSAYVPEFRLFSQSKKVADELRVINSFARMSTPSAKTKKIMLVEAMQVMGIRADETWLDHEVDEMLDVQGKGTQKRGIRNFIINNVIESSRFKYLIRYGNVKKIKGIAKNRKVVSFVLKEIPDTQIARYYNSITGNEGDYREGMRELLADRITGFTFEDISDVRQNDRMANQQEQEEKRQKQALVRMYLAVLYLAMKNLVYVNSRYSLAFHCVERDRLLMNEKYWKGLDNRKALQPEYGYTVFSKWHNEQYPPRPRVRGYLEQNYANADEWAIRTFRNKVEHLDAIRNADLYLDDVKEVTSWFELYHYIMQRRIMDQYEWDSTHPSKYNDGAPIISEHELNPKTREYFQKVKKYGTCCRDFVKALNTPFAYNLPRYKNLSIDGLFDRNRPGSGKMEAE